MSIFQDFWHWITRKPEHHLDQKNLPECSTYSIATALGKSAEWAQELYPHSDKVPQKALRYLVKTGEIKAYTQGKGAIFAKAALSRDNPLILVCPWPTHIKPNDFLDLTEVKGGHAITVSNEEAGVFTLKGSFGDSWADHGNAYLTSTGMDYLTYDLGGNLLEIIV